MNSLHVDDSAFDGVLKWRAHARVLKYDPRTVAEIARYHGVKVGTVGPAHLAGFNPDSIAEADGNVLTTLGLNRFTNLFIGAGGQAFTNARAVLGVGTTATAGAVGDIALGSDNTVNAYYQGADASNPTQSNGVITCNSTFASGNANFAWNEWAWGIATAAVVAGTAFATVSTSGVLINHKAQSLGTKVAGAVWTLQSTITLS